MTHIERQALAAALQVRAAADAYPRCGEGWPRNPAEVQAEVILAAAGYPVTLPPSDDQRAAIDAYGRRDGALKAEMNEAYEALRAARRTRNHHAVRAAEAAYRAAKNAVRENIDAYGRSMGAY